VINFRSYKKRRSLVPTLIVIVLALVLAFTSPFYIRSLSSVVLYPFQVVFTFGVNGFTSIPGSLMQLSNLAQENSQLKSEAKVLKTQLNLFAELEQENKQLKAVLNYKNSSPYGLRLIPCQIIAKNTSPWFTVVEINKGVAQGIKVNQAAITEKGLAGKVIETKALTSLVMLIIDPQFKVAAVDGSSRDVGIVVGQSSNYLLMKYVGAAGTINKDDQIITSQMSALFPAGVPIGKVKKAIKSSQDLFFHVEIEPAVNFSKLEHLFIVN